MGAPNAPVTSNERASKDRFGLWTRKRNYAARKLQLSVRKKHELHTHPPPCSPLHSGATPLPPPWTPYTPFPLSTGAQEVRLLHVP